MNKKSFYLAIIPFILLGCNKTDSGSNSSNDEKCIIKEDVEITFLCMADSNYLDSLTSIVDEFMKTEPHVKVALTNPLGAGKYLMLERSVIAGFFNGTYPDLVQCYPDSVVKYMERGYALKMDDYLNNKEYGIYEDGQSDYLESYLEEGSNYRSAEGTYSLPFCKSTELMYYNKTALIGLKLDGINNNNPLDEDYINNLTWEELFQNLCPAISAKNESLPNNEKLIVPSSHSAIFTYDSDENMFITLAKQYGYGYTSIDENGNPSIDFDNQEMKNMMKELRAAKDNGYLHTYGSYGYYVSPLFQNRNSLFTVSSTAGLTYNLPEHDEFEVGVARIPHAEGKDYLAINQGPSVCVLDHKDNNRALASYLLWRFLTNESNSIDWALSTGYMAIRNSSYQSDKYKDALIISEDDSFKDKAKARNLQKIADVKSHTFNTDVFKGSSNARQNVGVLLTNCLTTTENLNEVIDEMFLESSNEAKTHL